MLKESWYIWFGKINYFIIIDEIDRSEYILPDGYNDPLVKVNGYNQLKDSDYKIVNNKLILLNTDIIGCELSVHKNY